MSVQFHDPRGQSAAPVEAYAHRIDLSDGSPTIGLLANGFPDSDVFLDIVGEVLAEQLPDAQVASWNKRNASSAVSEPMLAEIVERCDAVVAAYGH